MAEAATRANRPRRAPSATRDDADHTAAGNRLGGFMHSTGGDAIAIERRLLAHEREVVEPTLF